MTPNIFRNEDFINSTKLMICFCHFLYSFSDSICYFENSWPTSLLTSIMFSLSICNLQCLHLWQIWGISSFCFWFLCHLFKPVCFIFLYVDSHSNLEISWTVILAVSVTKLDLFFLNRRTFIWKCIVPMKEKHPEAFGFVGFIVHVFSFFVSFSLI